MATDSERTPANSAPPQEDSDKLFRHIRQALADLDFGTVTIVVQNGRVVQIERHEKLRLIPNDRSRDATR